MAPEYLAEGASGQQNGIILLANATVAIFPDEMPEMEDCFFCGMGIVHALFSLLFVVIGVGMLATASHLRFSFAGIWCAAPVIASSVFSFITARRELRRDVKRLLLCLSIAVVTSICLTILCHESGKSDGLYKKWTDIEHDNMFKARNTFDGIGMVVGVLEALLCIFHMTSLISNLKDELIYRCCSRRKFKKHLKGEAKKNETGEQRHLEKKKSMLQRLIGDLEEEEAYKEKWLAQVKKQKAKRKKEESAWGGGADV